MSTTIQVRTSTVTDRINNSTNQILHNLVVNKFSTRLFMALIGASFVHAITDEENIIKAFFEFIGTALLCFVGIILCITLISDIIYLIAYPLIYIYFYFKKDDTQNTPVRP